MLDLNLSSDEDGLEEDTVSPHSDDAPRSRGPPANQFFHFGLEESVISLDSQPPSVPHSQRGDACYDIINTDFRTAERSRAQCFRLLKEQFKTSRKRPVQAVGTGLEGLEQIVISHELRLSAALAQRVSQLPTAQNQLPTAQSQQAPQAPKQVPPPKPEASKKPEPGPEAGKKQKQEPEVN